MENQLQQIIKEVSNLLDDRFELLAMNNFKNISEFNQANLKESAANESMPMLRLVIHYSSISDRTSVESYLSTIQSDIFRIKLLGRAVGIEIVIAESELA